MFLNVKINEETDKLDIFCFSYYNGNYGIMDDSDNKGKYYFKIIENSSLNNYFTKENIENFIISLG